MSDLPLMIKSGSACIDQPGGFYYGYFHQLMGGPDPQKSKLDYLGIGLGPEARLQHYAELAYAQASHQQRAQIVSVNVVRLCTNEVHSADPRKSPNGPQLERVVTVGLINSRSEPLLIEPPKLFRSKAEVARYQIAEHEFYTNVVAASLTSIERATVPVTSIYQASAVQSSRKGEVTAHIAYHGLANQIVIPWEPGRLTDDFAALG